MGFVLLLFSLCLLSAQADFDYEYLFLKQFGYVESSETPNAALLDDTLQKQIEIMRVGNEEPTTGEELPGRLFDPNTIKTMQLYAGLEQTGMIDEEVISMMRTPRCQNPDVVADVGAVRSFFLNDPHGDDSHNHDRKRAIRAPRGTTAQWSTNQLTYSFRNVTAKNPRTSEVIGQAFAAWAECSQLEFTELGRDDMDNVDIDIKFVTGHHPPPASDSFDGQGGVLAHAWYPPIGHTHFDDDEDWSDDCFLYSVALHEIGHALGLDHSPDRQSVMFAYFSPSESVCGADNTRPLIKDDIENIRKKYGSVSCDGDEHTEKPGGLEEYPSTATSGASALPTEGPELTPSGTFDSGPDIATTAGPNYGDWEIDCGSIVDNVLISPLYPSVYPNAVSCVWNFTAPGARDKVMVNFNEFSLEESKECKYDYLAISGDGVPQPVLLCGKREDSMIFDTSSITIEFKSDNLKQYKGFKIYLSVIEGEVCEAVYNDQSGIITSPGYPSHYTPNVECSYTVTAEPGKQMVLVFDELDYTSCSEQVMVLSHDGSPVPPSCTNHSLPLYKRGDVANAGDNLTIVFSAVSKRRAVPFRLRYFTVPTNYIIEIEPASTYTYESPGFSAGQYGHSTDLLISFTMSNFKVGDVLEVQFTELDIEDDKYCSYDYLEIFTEDTKPGRVCGQHKVPAITTLGAQVYLHFHTDGNVAGRGFKLTFSKQGCDANVTGDGVITSPNYPAPYTKGDHCTYTFPAKYLVCFTELYTASTGYCSAESDHFIKTKRLGSLGYSLSDSFIAKGERICDRALPQLLEVGERLEFKANLGGAGHYKLSYYKIEEQCGYEITEAQTVSFYGTRSRAGNSQCAWIIRGDDDVLAIEVLVVEAKLTGKTKKGCVDGSLRVEDKLCSSEKSYPICKKELKKKRITIQGNFAVLRLDTKSNQLDLVVDISFIRPVKCIDVHQHCFRFNKKYCKHAGYSSWMVDNCAKYCGRC